MMIEMEINPKKNLNLYMTMSNVLLAIVRFWLSFKIEVNYAK